MAQNDIFQPKDELATAWSFDGLFQGKHKYDFCAQRRVLSRACIPKWLRLQDVFAPPVTPDFTKGSGIRILCIPSTISPRVLNTDKETWTAISTAFNLHPASLEVILDNNGAFAAYYSKDRSAANQLLQIHLLMKVPNYRVVGNFAISLTYDHPSRMTTAVIHGGMLPDRWDRCVSLLRENMHLCAHPTLLPALVFIIYRSSIEQHRAAVDKTVLDTENYTGYGSPRSFVHLHHGTVRQDDPPPPPPDVDGLTLNFEWVLKRLQSYQTVLSTLANVVRFTQEWGQFIRKCTDEFDHFLPTDDADALSMSEDILQLLELPCSQVQTAHSQIQALKERVQSQANLVFGLMSREENRISRMMAEHSAGVAVVAKRDSSAMKTIAFLTMAFLPGTFVATVLSTPFFQWSGEADEPPVTTKYFWIYCVVAIPLTLSMLVGWRVWWKYEEKTSHSEIQLAKEGTIRHLNSVNRAVLTR
ncbi:hypothetical protein B0H66DRAFT_546202 [Apodospora peruviana]|uniref:Uncharacterized protein n=1 Tax=Apodospora peruviana TaxID=516989 RepID=A0AAE0IVG0_9PEZI|nr:hypothetical protein B0H66DRAFT_546202 [Apodospora peruviana]